MDYLEVGQIVNLRCINLQKPSSSWWFKFNTPSFFPVRSSKYHGPLAARCVCAQLEFPLVHKEGLPVCVCTFEWEKVNAHTSENVLLVTLWPTFNVLSGQCAAALRHTRPQRCFIRRLGVTFIYFNFLSCQTQSLPSKKYTAPGNDALLF